MDLEYLPIPEARGSGGFTPKWRPLIAKFYESGEPSARIAKEPENFKSTYSAIGESIRTSQFAGRVRVVMRKPDIYLERVES